MALLPQNIDRAIPAIYLGRQIKDPSNAHPEGDIKMPITTRSLLPALLAAALLLPANIYAIGNGIGAGIRFPLFLYQDTTYGASLIPVWREISYVTSGTIGGRSAVSILLWVLGTALLIAAIVYFAARRKEDHETFRKPLALLVAGAGVAYLLSCIAQYGPTLYGPAGFAVPVGVPLILAVAWYIVRVEEDDELGYEEEEEEEYGEEMEEEQ